MTCRSFMTNALPALLLASSTVGHIIMSTPAPFAGAVLDPLGLDDWPCQKSHGFKVVNTTQMVVGDTQTLSFPSTQSAVHGGGSCQMSITLDMEPNEQSQFKVIHSIEGGCPGLVASPFEFPYQIPGSVPNGEATIAWTWFSRMSGLPEIYMNCGRVEISGGADDTAQFDQLPDLLVANVAGLTGHDCTSPQMFDTKYPDPGDSVDTSFADKSIGLKPPAGPDCGPVVDSPVPSSTSEAPAPTTTKEAPTKAPTTPTTQPSLTTSVVPVPSSPAPSPSTPPSTGGDSCSGTAMLCKGTSQFGLCDNGSVVWQAVAPGTQCQNGQIVKKRSSRMVRRRVMQEWAL